MPRRTAAQTRTLLLDTGVRLLERYGPAEVTLESVAAAAGVSRQAVYNHFGSRARFLLDAMEHQGGNKVFVAADAIVRDAASADDALRGVIALRANQTEAAYAIAAAFAGAAYLDADAKELWEARQLRRLTLFRQIAQRFRTEGRLRRGLTVDDAGALIWSTISLETWRYLGVLAGWSPQQFTSKMHALLIAGLTDPEDAPVASTKTRKRAKKSP